LLLHNYFNLIACKVLWPVFSLRSLSAILYPNV
jgi:hypothetical protein